MEEEKKFEEEKKEGRKQEIFKSLFDDNKDFDEKQMDELMNMWQTESYQMEQQQQLFQQMREWGNKFTGEEVYAPKEIQFQENNPFMDKENNL